MRTQHSKKGIQAYKFIDSITRQNSSKNAFSEDQFDINYLKRILLINMFIQFS
jgi:hypothetical protein